MDYDKLLHEIEDIQGNHAKFECLTIIFTLKLFDDDFFNKISSKYIYPHIEPFSEKFDFNFLNWIKNDEVEEYLRERYKENILEVLNDTFTSLYVNFELFQRIKLIIKSMEHIPSIYDSFLLFIDDNKTLVSDQIVELCNKLINNESQSIYIPFSNGLRVSKYSQKKVYCEYSNEKMKIVKMFMKIYEDKDINLNITDSLMLPSFFDNQNFKQFDTVIAFPPFGVIREISKLLYFDRFKIHSGKKRLDVAHFEHVLSQTKNQAIVLMPVGFTFRSGVEEEFRKYLIQNNFLDAMIQFPPNMYSETAIESSMFIIDKNRNMNDDILFINLKDKSYLTKIGRKTVFKDIDKIAKIYLEKSLDSKSRFVSQKEIVSNDYNFSIDRYINKLEINIPSIEWKNLEDIAIIRKSQTIKEVESGDEVIELSPSDFSNSGYTISGKKIKKINLYDKPFETYHLRPYDILISAKGIVGKVGLIGENINNLLASQAIQVIRLNSVNDIKRDAISLYMFLKSDIGQKALTNIVQGTAMPQISTKELKKFQVPSLTENDKLKIINSFEKEIEIFNEIYKLQEQVAGIHKDYLK